MIEAKGLIKDFGALRVLNAVDLSVDSGEIVAVTGPSGAGKTTLLQIVGSLERPTAGSVLYDGRDIFSMGDNALARFRNANIGFIFQFHQLLPEFTLEENVAMPALIGGTRRAEAMARARSLLDYMGLSERLTHRPAQLSGGEQQRGAVARALVNSPRIVLADEPSGSLDSRNRRDLQDLFFALRRDLGHSFVIVTHDEALAAETDRTIHMRDGQIHSITVNDEPRR